MATTTTFRIFAQAQEQADRFAGLCRVASAAGQADSFLRGCQIAAGSAAKVTAASRTIGAAAMKYRPVT